MSGKVPWMVAEETVTLMEILNSGDSDEARFIGGCVRDALANRKSFDVDIAVNYRPARTIDLLKENNIKYVPTGLKHGTVTAVINGITYEITSLREDIETDGRHAKVKFTTEWEKDAARRDFTINAISANMEGELFDYFGGIEDLRLGRVRFIGSAEKRIEEDYLRILRFFRFYGIFARGEIDSEAYEACKNNVKGLEIISKERICAEMFKILAEAKPARVLDLMKHAGIFNILMHGNDFDEQVLYRLEKLEEQYNNQEEPIRRLLILVSNKKDALECLKLSNYHKDSIARMIAVVKDISLASEIIEIQKLVYKYGSDMIRSALLVKAAENDDVTNLDKLYNAATSFNPPRFPVTGDDIKEQGIEEGKAIGLILKELETWWVDNSFTPKRTDCLEKLKDILYKYS